MRIFGITIRIFKKREKLSPDAAFVAGMMGYSEKEFIEILKSMTFDLKGIERWKEKEAKEKEAREKDEKTGRILLQ